MNWRTHPWMIRARNVGRHLGVNRWIGAMRAARGYEDRFQRSMLGGIRSGDCVWDVGANVGLYSAQFAERVGDTGCVLAFEPSPINLVALRAKVAGIHNVSVFPMALGAETGSAQFEQGADPLGATSRIVSTNPRGGVVDVPIMRGAELVKAGTARAPNVIKIDTEGHELDVLNGLSELLPDPALRLLCIEVHFGLLARRGTPQAPSQIEKMLTNARFAVSWPDASHIVADRESS